MTLEGCFGSWFYLESLDVCVCVPAKCGITSLRVAMWPWAKGMTEIRKKAADEGFGPYTPRRVMEERPHTRKIMSVRDPVERFGSLWRDKCRRERYNQQYWEKFKGMTPDELMDLIERWPLGNSHWFPQYYYTVPDAEIVPYDRLGEFLGVEIAARNVTEKRGEDPALPKERILDHYRKDLELWNLRSV